MNCARHREFTTRLNRPPDCGARRGAIKRPRRINFRVSRDAFVAAGAPRPPPTAAALRRARPSIRFLDLIKFLRRGLRASSDCVPRPTFYSRQFRYCVYSKENIRFKIHSFSRWRFVKFLFWWIIQVSGLMSKNEIILSWLLP